jgi:hypothetical protein
LKANASIPSLWSSPHISILMNGNTRVTIMEAV